MYVVKKILKRYAMSFWMKVWVKPLYKRGLKVVFLKKDLTFNVVFAIGRDERGEKRERDRGNEEGKKTAAELIRVHLPLFSHSSSFFHTLSHTLFLSYTKTLSHSYSSLYHARTHTHSPSLTTHTHTNTHSLSLSYTNTP